MGGIEARLHALETRLDTTVNNTSGQLKGTLDRLTQMNEQAAAQDSSGSTNPNYSTIV
jgi:hypothetical protein